MLCEESPAEQTPSSGSGSEPGSDSALLGNPEMDEEETIPSGQWMDRRSRSLPSMSPSYSRDSVSGEEPFCRICHDGGCAGELLVSCECAGSLARVHRVCLERWLSTSGTCHCELCLHEYTLERKAKPLTEWLVNPSVQQHRRTLCGDAVCFLFITPLASLSGWLCLRGAVDLYYTSSLEAMGLLGLTLALLTIYLLWTVVSLRYHIHLFRTWSETNQKVRLRIPQPQRTSRKQETLILHFLCKDTSKETVV